MFNNKKTSTLWREIVGGFTYPYALRREIVGGFSYYYLSFTDGQNTPCEKEITRQILAEFMRFNKSERRQLRWNERHVDQADLTDEELHERAFNRKRQNRGRLKWEKQK